MGADLTQICCLYEGIAFKKSVKKFNFGGNQVTEHLIKKLSERGYQFQTNSNFYIANEIKEKLCYIPLDYLSEMQNFATSPLLEKTFELPDGEVITLGHEMIVPTQAYFDPTIVGSESRHSLHHSIYQSIIGNNFF
jgi:actin-related protein